MQIASFRDRVSLLLANLEEGREVRTYIQQFARARGGFFAVIKIGGALIADQLDALGERLAVLQALGLCPIVVYGAGPQLDARLSAAGIVTPRRQNLRVTPPEAMTHIADEIAALGLSLVAAIGRAGGRALFAPPSTICAAPLDAEHFGRVGRAEGVRAGALAHLEAAGSIPLIGCVAQDEHGQLLNVNADDVAREVAIAVQPVKIVFLTSTGGILDGAGRVIDSINLASDFGNIMAEPWLHSGMALKLSQIESLLSALPASSSVSITTTEHLIRELFTHGGAGTLVRRGEAIVDSTTFDQDRMTNLIVKGFGRQLRNDYWQTEEIRTAIFTEEFRAAAVVTDLDGTACLCKFSVDPDARGEGLAKAVWRRLRHRFPALIWRSRPANPFNRFYADEADAFMRIGKWNIYWFGFDDLNLALAAANRLAARPADFVEG